MIITIKQTVQTEKEINVNFPYVTFDKTENKFYFNSDINKCMILNYQTGSILNLHFQNDGLEFPEISKETFYKAFDENIQTLLELKALDLLESYSGANNYILYLKNKKSVSKKFYPTRSQADYIITYFDYVPKVARKWVDLDTYFAKKFAEERYLLEVPEQIYIEKLLVVFDFSLPVNF